MAVHFDELIIKELSLVDKAANKEKWLLYKSEDAPNQDEIMGVVLNSDLESLEKMVSTIHEIVNKMLAKTKKKGYEYPYPGVRHSEEDQARHKHEEDEEEQARKKKKEEEEEQARKKKKEEEEMATLKAQVQELTAYKKTVDELLPTLQKQIEELSYDALLTEAKKM